MLCFLDVPSGVEQCVCDSSSYMNREENLVTVTLLKHIVSTCGVPSASVGEWVPLAVTGRDCRTGLTSNAAHLTAIYLYISTTAVSIKIVAAMHV